MEGAMASELMLSVSGCRGIVGESLTPEVVSGFAGAYASWLGERAKGGRVLVVLGCDGRAGGRMVRDAAVAGLAGAGCDVVDLGVAMTPTTAVMTDVYARGEGERRGWMGPGRALVAGMVITASHNPQQWNGLKCLFGEAADHGSGACAPEAGLAAEIIERYRAGRRVAVSWDKVGRVIADDSGVRAHVERVGVAMEDAGLCTDPGTVGAGLRVALDSCNASGIEGGRAMLEALGVDEVLHVGAERDPELGGFFPHPPEPTEANLSQAGGLCDGVREGGCDVGFAQDPDADRLAIIDEKGRYIGEEYTLALGAMALLEASKGTGERVLVTNLSTSRMLDDVAARHGAQVLRTPVGEAHVVSVMKRERKAGREVVCAGEGNGGVIWPRAAYVRDSLSAMALVLWLLSPAGGGRGVKRRLSDLVASLPSYSIRKRKVDLKRREDATPVIERIAAHHAAQRIDRSDGVWVDFTSGALAGRAWLHVRASNTEPIMRLIAEAPSERDAESLLDEAARIAGGR